MAAFVVAVAVAAVAAAVAVAASIAVVALLREDAAGLGQKSAAEEVPAL